LYPIDLQTILQIFASQSGELRAKVKQVDAIKGEFQASVVLLQGKVVSCQILHEGKPVRMGESAFSILVNKGVLQWEYIPVSPVSSGPLSSVNTPIPPSLTERSQDSPLPQSSENSIPPGFFPIQQTRVSVNDRARWSHPYRSVYLLSTGEKTVKEIARLLSLTPAHITSIMQELVKSGVISLQPNPKRPSF
jgi:hypothetical protein